MAGAGLQLQVKKGETKRLPSGATYTAGLGWDPAAGQDTVDLDLWILRKKADGTVEPIFWGNSTWHRPDLGSNSEGNPYVATPEGDVVYQGDDRTGEESDTGYDENAVLDLSKAPADVVQYAVFATNYDDPEVDPPVKLMGHATNVVFGCKESASGNEFVTKPADDFAFDVTVLLCTIDRDGDHWTMTSVEQGYTDSMIKVAQALGISFG